MPFPSSGNAPQEALQEENESPTRNLGAWTWWGVTLVFNIMFIVMHIFNYPSKPNYGLYYFLVLSSCTTPPSAALNSDHEDGS